MNSINLSKINQKHITNSQNESSKKPVSLKSVIPASSDSTLVQDTYESTNNESKKKFSFKSILSLGIVIGILTGLALFFKKGKTKVLSFDEFKKIGGRFENGKAINKNGKLFNGTLTKETKDDLFTVEYTDGLMRKSTKNYSDLVDEYSTKEYSYSEDGNIKEVISKTFTIDKAAKEACLGLNETARRLIDKKYLYKEQITKKTLYDDKKIQMFNGVFTDTIEGKRRAQMSDEEISAEVQRLFDKVLDEKGIDKRVAPEIKIKPDSNITHGGSYNSSYNVLEINPNSYRAGVFDLENVVMHEGTHFEEALLRSRLSDDTISEVIKNKLLSRISEGEADEIIVSGNLLITKTIKTPKLSEKMKKEFQEFAADNLYTDNYEFQKNLQGLFDDEKINAVNDVQKEILAKITKLIDDNPDFVRQYSSKEEAIEMLTKYSASHNTRYTMMTQKPRISTSILPKLTPEEEKRAIESLNGYLETLEGNARIGGFKFLGSTQQEFNNYQFSREEVLAQEKGNTFAIKEIKEKIEQMKKDGTYTPEFESYFNDAINKSQLTIEYKTKGRAWYQKYIQSLNNPDDIALKEAVDKEWKELSTMLEQINSPLIPTGVWERVKK